MGSTREHSNEIIQESSPVLFFDGVCNLCTASVQFLLKRDKTGLLRFASLQSKLGQQILKSHHLPQQEFRSLLYLDKDVLYQKSSAFLMACRHLKGLWPLLYVFMAVPRFLRDAAYELIARNRYRWFGKKEECWLPNARWKSRFLE